MKTQSVSSPYGIKQGKFSVDADGAANYVLPIEIPPGIAGAQPKISLHYNHRLGNGICGLGWALNGLSSISRTNATKAIDNFRGSINYDSNDRFELDGVRLVNIDGKYGVAGTVYYAEHHQWEKIVAGPSDKDGFTVYKKSGEVWSYGKTTDSLIMANGSTTKVREWALSSIRDLNGNMVKFNYTAIPVTGGEDTGAYYISSIDYTVRDQAKGNFSLTFDYVPRTDVLTTYFGGSLVETKYLLNAISVNMGTTLIRTYSLTYQQSSATGLSRLISIATADGEGYSLPPLTFDWTDVTSPGFDINQSASAMLINQGLIQTVPTDANGNGLTDIMQFYVDENSMLNVATYLASCTNGLVTYAQSSALSIQMGYYGDGSSYAIFVADVNGNGINDIVVPYRNDSGFLCFDVYINSGSALADAITTTTTDLWQGTDSIGFYPMDIDGDGCIDMVELYNDGNSILNINAYQASFNGSEPSFAAAVSCNTNLQLTVQNVWPMDVNGDGLIDLVLLSNNEEKQTLETTAFVSTDSSSGLSLFTKTVQTSLETTTNGQITILPADVNGDGVIDILQLSEQGGSFIMQSMLSVGDGSFVIGASTSFDNETYTASQLYPMGINGNGQTAVVATWQDAGNWCFTVFSSSPSGAFTKGDTVATGKGMALLNFSVGDVNGNGKADMMYMYTDAEINSCVLPFPSQGQYPDMLSNIADQMGNNIAVSYSPLTDSSVYNSKETLTYPLTTAVRYPGILSPAQFPVQDVIGRAMYVVSGYKMANDDKVNRYDYELTYQMQYSNALIDLSGRGWLGFETMQVLDTKTGLQQTKAFLQEFPFTGCVSSVARYANGNYTNDPKVAKGQILLLSNTIHTYQSVQQVAGKAQADGTGVAYEVRKTGQLSYKYDYGEESFDYLTAFSFSYDDYGNQSERVWWGYVDYIDPTKVSSTQTFPTVSPKAQDEVVYRFSRYQNDILKEGWALGYLLYDKQTANKVNADITTFQEGDYTLTACTYVAGTYMLATSAAWDSQNKGMLISSFTYDQFGNMLSQTDPGYIKTQFTYETVYNTYRDSMLTPPNAQQVQLATHYGFDPRYGVQVAEKDANGTVSISVTDGFGRIVKEQGAVPAACSQSDPNQCTSFVTGSEKFVDARVLTLRNCNYVTDGSGGIYKEEELLQDFPTDTTRVFHSNISFADGLGRETQVALTSTADKGFAQSITTYHANGSVATKSVPFFSTDFKAIAALKVVAYTYDVLKRLTSVVTPTGPENDVLVTNSMTYEAGECITITSAAGSAEQYVQQIVNHTFNGNQRQIRSTVISDNNAVTTFAYDALGRQTSCTDPQGVVNSIVYDSLGRKLTYDNPDQNTTQNNNLAALKYIYDAKTGNVKTITDVAGNSVTYDYDLLGRIVSQTYSDKRVYKMVYDTASYGIFKMTSASVYAANGVLESERVYAYDEYGNTVSDTLIIGASSYTTSSVFDPMKRSVQQTYNDGSQLTRSYGTGLLLSQQLDSVSLTYPQESYDAGGCYTEMQYGFNGNKVLDAAYKYNFINTMYGETLKNSDNVLLDATFTFDQLDQLTSDTDSVTDYGQSFQYSARRLTTVTGAGANIPSGSYNYDTGSRLLSKDGSSYKYDHSNFPCEISGPASHTALRDTCGRVISRTIDNTITTFDYDAANNLSGISVNESLKRSMLYDWKGKRIREIQEDGTETVYVSSSFRVSTNAAQNETITKYITDQYGPVASIAVSGDNTTVLFFRRDQKGNITHIIGSDGSLEGRFAYDGFGVPTTIGTLSVKGAVPQYEAHTMDSDTGLYYFNARYYDPRMGFFLTPDARLGASHKLVPGAWNRYAFELNNPVNHLDPDGHVSTWAKVGIFVGLVALTAVAVVLTPVTGGASDVAVGAMDSSALGTGGVEGAEVSIEMTDFSATSADTSVATSTEATASAETSAGMDSTGTSLASRITKVAVRIGVNAIKGAGTGAGLGGSSEGIAYVKQNGFNSSLSGFFHAFLDGAETGAIAGAVGGAVAGELTAAINPEKYSGFSRVIVKGAIGAAASVSGTIAKSEIIDHQFPSAKEIEKSAEDGFKKGVKAARKADSKLNSPERITKGVTKGKGNNQIEIELTQIARKV